MIAGEKSKDFAILMENEGVLYCSSSNRIEKSSSLQQSLTILLEPQAHFSLLPMPLIVTDATSLPQ